MDFASGALISSSCPASVLWQQLYRWQQSRVRQCNATHNTECTHVYSRCNNRFHAGIRTGLSSPVSKVSGVCLSNTINHKQVGLSYMSDVHLVSCCWWSDQISSAILITLRHYQTPSRCLSAP